MPARCAASSAAATCRPISMADAAASMPLRPSRSVRLSPSSFSIAMYAAPWAGLVASLTCPHSNTVTMPGWEILAAERAS